MVLEGTWKKNDISYIIRKSELTVVIRFQRYRDYATASSYIPSIVDEFLSNDSKESLIRNDRGYWIDEVYSIAAQDMHMKGRYLYGRLYTCSLFVDDLLFC